MPPRGLLLTTHNTKTSMMTRVDKHALDATSPNKLEAGGQNMETIMQRVAVQSNPLLTGQTQTLNIVTQNTITNTHKDTEEGTLTVPEGLQPLPTIHTPYPLTIQSHMTLTTAKGSYKS